MNEPQKKTVYFVRHGQSIDNAAPVFQSINSRLSPKGISQAERIAARLTRIEFEALIASPVRRAKETAAYIAKNTKHEVIYSDLFVERIKPSEIDGKAWTDQQANKIWRDWEKSLYTPGMRVSNGENYDDIVARADQALAFLTARPEQALAVVTHGYFLRTIIARVLMGDYLTGPIMKHFQERTSTENTAITVLNYQNDFEQGPAWQLWTFNDHSHFAE